jgi:hypothetical protein
LTVVGGCVGLIYFIYRIVKGKRERYFKFDDKQSTGVNEPNKAGLSKIEEMPDEEYQSTVDNARSKRSSVSE